MPALDGKNAQKVSDAFLHSEEFYVERVLRTVCEQFKSRLHHCAKLDRTILLKVTRDPRLPLF